MRFKATIVKEERFLRDLSINNRVSIMGGIIGEYVSDISNLTTEQLSVTQKLVDIMNMLNLTPPDEYQGFYDQYKDLIELELITLKQRLIGIIITPCYSRREYLIFNYVYRNWGLYTQFRYSYDNSPVFS